jgi:uncharacterized protein
MKRRVEFPVANQKLAGDLYLPEDISGPFPCVITSHGYKSNRQSEKWIQVGLRLPLEGIGVLAFDHRGALHGESDGIFENTTLSARIENMAAAINYVSQIPEIDPSRIGLLGSSLGGVDVILTQSESVRTKVIMSTPFRIPPPSESMKSAFANKGYWDYEDGTRIRKEFYEDLNNHDVIAHIEQEKCPLLIIHGNLDETVPRHHSIVLLERAGSKIKVLHMIDGADHSFSELDKLNQALSYAFDWFKKYLAAR